MKPDSAMLSFAVGLLGALGILVYKIVEQYLMAGGE